MTLQQPQSGSSDAQQIEERVKGTLYLVGTPIGNLEDITMRALRVLKEVDLIAAEDTRHTGKLLHYFQIKTPQISCHEHNEQQKIPEILEKLQSGKSIALVTDAGMPGISDPGYILVAACVAAGAKVIPIPGVTALVTGLSASGLDTSRFVFEGFLPVKGEVRQAQLQALKTEVRTTIFYESPHRIVKTLADLGEVCGCDRQIVLARELTKMHEEFWRGSLGEAIELYNRREPKGEYTMILAGIVQSEIVWTDESIVAELSQLLKSGVSRSTASKQLAELTGINKRHVYQLSLAIAFDGSKTIDSKKT
jgi:16S rRNA (cytidine1402-2'-O)-methyltransferase